MDPRSQVTAAELNDQLRVGMDIFNQLLSARKTQSEIAAVRKHISELPAPFLSKHQDALAAVTSVNAQIERIEKGDKGPPGAITGLELATMGLNAALRVVENSDRAIPSQAMEVYRESDRVAQTSVAEWTKVKGDQLNKLNETLKKSGMNAIQIAEI